MSEFEIRPRYKFRNAASVSELDATLNRVMKENAERWPLNVRQTTGHRIFSYRPPAKHLWSPEMDLNLEEDKDNGGTIIRVLIGPASAVWTFFMFLYSICAIVLFGGFILSYSQYALGKDIWGFWLIPISVFMAIAVFLAGYWGKKRARRQMINFKKFFDRAFPESILLEGDLNV